MNFADKLRQVFMAEGNSPCPRCGAPAYHGFTAIECPTPGCQYFTQKQADSLRPARSSNLPPSQQPEPDCSCGAEQTGAEHTEECYYYGSGGPDSLAPVLHVDHVLMGSDRATGHYWVKVYSGGTSEYDVVAKGLVDIHGKAVKVDQGDAYMLEKSRETWLKAPGKPFTLS